MNRCRYQRQETNPLAYRMRETVKYFTRDVSPTLILSFPLKAMVLHPLWRPVFDRLSRGAFVSLGNITSLIDHPTTEEVELFLNELVRKGFLEQRGFSTPVTYPGVSIIIPVRNRPEEISTCLKSLTQLDYPRENMEIIVVDDASDDNTPSVVSEFPANLIALREHKQASFCRNLAAQHAKGNILAFIDSDCLADPLWLRELIPAFTDASLGAVGGLVDSYFDENDLDHYERVKSPLNMGSWFKSSREGEKFFYVPSCNLLVRRGLFLRLRGFKDDLHVGEDVDFCWRVQDYGYHVEYRPIGKVYHKHRNKLRPFCFRRFDYGTSESFLQLLHGKRIKHMIFPPAESLFWGILVLSTFLKYMPLLGLSGIVGLIDSMIRFAKITNRNIPISFHHMFLPVFRSYLAFFFHVCSFVSRYYLFWAIPVFPVMPLVSMAIIGMHLLAGLVEYIIRRPDLNFISFFLYFSLDQFSYQFGVWWGCVKNLSFGPINPKIVYKTTQKEIR